LLGQPSTRTDSVMAGQRTFDLAMCTEHIVITVLSAVVCVCVCVCVHVLAVHMDAEDEQLLEDEVAVPTDSKRSVPSSQLAPACQS